MKQSQVLMTGLAQLRFGVALYCTVSLAAQTLPEESARQIVLLPPSGTESYDQEIRRWQQRLAERSTEPAYWERLGWAYIAKARRSQDVGFYKLAELTVNAWESACGSSGQALLLRGHVYHNLHRFKDAEVIARHLVTDRNSPADSALLCDALMEQGKLDEAVEACQTLTNLRPGVESSSRIAHLRWLSGDLNGAIDAMQSAVRAADPRDRETCAWLYTRLAGYGLLNGDMSQAVALSEQALSAVSEYPPALAMKGRALYSDGKYESAIVLLRQAAEYNPVPDNQWWLADALRAQGQEDEAQKIEAKLRRHGSAIDPRTLALFLATRGEDLERAVTLASKELTNRSDVFTHDALAFAFLRSGKLSQAAGEMKLATAHQIQDPRLALHAGLLADKMGDRATADLCYQRATIMAAAFTPSEKTLLSERLRAALIPVR